MYISTDKEGGTGPGETNNPEEARLLRAVAGEREEVVGMAARIISWVRTREAAAAARVTLAVTGDATAGEVAAETEATAGKAARTTV